MLPWFTALPFLHLIQCSSAECYHDARFEKESRYYVIRLSKDLLDDWVITLINGRIKSKLGQSRTLAFTHFCDAFDHFCALANIRQKRGYELRTITCDNPLMLHLLPLMVFTEAKSELPVAPNVKNINQLERRNKKPASTLSNFVPQALVQQLGFRF